MKGGRSSLGSLGLRHGESVDFTIRGACMQLAWNAQPVRVCRQRVYLPGDVVVIRRSDRWNAHRFLGYAPSVHGVVVLTQADDASLRDPAARWDAIVGRAECAVSVSDRLRALVRYAGALTRRAMEVIR